MIENEKLDNMGRRSSVDEGPIISPEEKTEGESNNHPSSNRLISEFLTPNKKFPILPKHDILHKPIEIKTQQHLLMDSNLRFKMAAQPFIPPKKKRQRKPVCIKTHTQVDMNYMFKNNAFDKHFNDSERDFKANPLPTLSRLSKPIITKNQKD